MAQAMSRIRDLTYLSDRLPTGYQGTGSACVRPEATIYVAGVGPVDLACAAACQLLGAPK
jgi:glutathione-independent formaldehyde dehydrogenase